jgi:type I site-specific restriction endonuclease
MKKTPHKYQLGAFDAITAATKKGVTRFLVVMAMGLGKTFIAAMLVRRWKQQKRTRQTTTAHEHRCW